MEFALDVPFHAHFGGVKTTTKCPCVYIVQIGMQGAKNTETQIMQRAL